MAAGVAIRTGRAVLHGRVAALAADRVADIAGTDVVIVAQNGCGGAFAAEALVAGGADVIVGADRAVAGVDAAAFAGRCVASIYGARVSIVTADSCAADALAARAQVILRARVAVGAGQALGVDDRALARDTSIGCASIIVIAVAVRRAVVATAQNRLGAAFAGRWVATIGRARIIVAAGNQRSAALGSRASIGRGARIGVVARRAIGIDEDTTLLGVATIRRANVFVITDRGSAAHA